MMGVPPKTPCIKHYKHLKCASVLCNMRADEGLVSQVSKILFKIKEEVLRLSSLFYIQNMSLAFKILNKI